MRDGFLKYCPSVRQLKGLSRAGILFSNLSKKEKIFSVGL